MTILSKSYCCPLQYSGAGSTLKAILVDNNLDVGENIRKMMSLVDNHSLGMAIEERFGIGLYLSQCVGILQTDVWQVREQLTAQRGLTRLTRSSKCNDRQDTEYVRNARC